MGVVLGRVLAGKYRVERLLGEGGMGVVVAATHVALDQKVAIKFMRPEAAAKQNVAARFMREARAAARLRCEHVGRVLDVGSFEDGSPYIVMEFLDGIDLGESVRRYGPIPIPLACDYVLQAGVAVAEAHSQGIVHRDLKPANLFLARDAEGASLVKVLDFGISKVGLADGGDLSLTQTGVILGSPSYMSPEQLRSTKDADARSDIWSLGVILYELVSARLPFAAESFSAVCLNVTLSEPAPLGIPGAAASAVEAVIRRCLEKEPSARYPTVAALAKALAPLAPPHARRNADRASHLLRAGPGSVDRGSAEAAKRAWPRLSTTNSGSAAEIAGRRSSETPRRRGWLLAGIIAFSVVGVAALVVALHGGGPEAPPAAAEPASLAAGVDPPSPPPSLVPDAAPHVAAEPSARPDAGVPATVASPPPPPPKESKSRPRPTKPRIEDKKAKPPIDPLGSAD